MTLKPEVLAAMDQAAATYDELRFERRDDPTICEFWTTRIAQINAARTELLAMDARLNGVDIYNPSSSLKTIEGYVVLVDGSVLKTIHPTLEAARERAMQCYADKHLVSIATIGGPTKLA